MRLVHNKTCKQCCYFEPDTSMCQLDSEYEYVSPRKTACQSFASDDEDDIDIEISVPDFNNFDEENYF